MTQKYIDWNAFGLYTTVEGLFFKRFHWTIIAVM